MRRRAVRDLVTLLGVVLILAGVVAANVYMRLDSLKELARKARIQMEKQRKAEGVKLLEWETLRTTKGTFRSGPRFKPPMEGVDNHACNIVGFMAPIDQFRKVSHFMLLPMPITCYFCESPPLREVIEVQLREGVTADMVNEPVLIGGLMRLNRDKGAPFFYTLSEAKWGEAVTDEEFTEKQTPEEHREHLLVEFKKLLGETDEGDVMLPPDEAPSGSGQ
ncbi:MAG: DUF3299 domain-containing protein [Candidatus Hydrogenedentes bacterium]|nr:DUF3299 domain-containing protein [Candidatus Hydrogenedentota bacterium]